MKKKGFTLIELLAVIVILSLTVMIVIVKVDKNIKDANKFGNERTTEMLENAATLYVENYRSELSNINSKGVDVITIDKLINKGLIESKDVNDPVTNVIVVAVINDVIRAKYTKTSMNVIFLKGSSEISIYKGNNYVELGAYVAIPGSGLVELTNSNISSTVNKNTIGKYKVTYTYSGASSVERIVNVI